MEVRRALFECEGITKNFGGLRALSGVSFNVWEKEIVGIIGPNGAGKTTLFNIISGIFRPTSGVLRLDGKSLLKHRPYMICGMGIGRTYQTVRPFLGFTALQNVVAGVLFGRSEQNQNKRAAEEKAAELLRFVGLEGKEKVLANNLNLVERKKVELARALAGDPKLILLDEILAGLNPGELESSMLLINRIRDDHGVAIMWIEHIMKALMRVCERVIVLHHGEKIAEGTPREIGANVEVNEVYLGGQRAK
jgi:branched-chain amino acid transport system ATP-binding protein